MYLVSTGKTTVLSDFADLETKSTYQHKNGETTDFQFYNASELFVEVNKKAGPELMRIKETKQNEIEIQRVRKLKIENAHCVACSRQSLDEIAVGHSDGQVKIYNYRKIETLQRFIGDKFNSVVFLDYNISDDYIAGVQENGIINIFGTKTGVKIESVNIDSNSTLARFHPTKRFQLAVASYKGAVTTYDISDKRKTFHSADSHNAPCRDLCASMASPYTLLSVGYDCIINIFDTRRKGYPIKLNHNHPLSTVALSDCGTFFCVGNLKGELTTYDMRLTKKYLSMKKIHDCPVNRVAFAPQVVIDKQADITSNISCTRNSGAIAEQRSVDARKSFAATRGQRDSFCDFLDIQTNRGIEKSSRCLTPTTGRDSFDWDVLTRKTSTKNRASLFSDGSNLSPINDNVSNVRAVYSFGDSFEKKLQSTESKKQETSSEVQSSAPLREINRQSSQQISPLGKLRQIEEEQTLHHTTQENTLNISSSSDKENPQIHLELHKQSKSTPVNAMNELCRQNSSPANDYQKFQKLLDEQRANVRADVDARLHQLEFDLNLVAERNKWAVFTQSFNLWQEQIKNTEEIHSALSALLQTDPFVVEFTRLKEENKALKEENKALKSQLQCQSNRRK